MLQYSPTHLITSKTVPSSLISPNSRHFPDAIIPLLQGPVAQLVEQRIENPRVTGSIPVQATKLNRCITFCNTAVFFYAHRSTLVAHFFAGIDLRSC
jgi:hypothetical protein